MAPAFVSARMIGGISVPCIAPPEWQNVEVMPGYACSFQLLSKRILLQTPAGIASTEGIRQVQQLRDKFLEEFLGPYARFIQVKNYSEVPGLPARDSRKVQADFFLQDFGRCEGMFACGLSPMMRTMIRVGLIVTHSPYPFKLFGHEADALREALLLEGGLSSIDSLPKLEYQFTLEDWKIDLNGLSVEAWVIAPHVFCLKCSGWLRHQHLEFIDALQRRVFHYNCLNLDQYFRIMDLSGLKGSDWKSRSQFRGNMESIFAEFKPPQMSFICDANPLIRTAYQIFAGNRRSSLRFCPSVDKALQMIREQLHPTHESNKSALPVVDDDVQQLAENIGQMSWKEPDPHFPVLPANHRLRPVYEALELVHLDLHSLLETSEADAAQLKQAKSALDSALKARSELLTVANHEIRTPLNGLQGMLELIQQCKLPPEAAEYLETAQQCSSDLADLLTNLLDLSSVEAGRLQLEPSYFSPQLIAMDLEQKHARIIKSHQVDFSVKESGAIDAVVFGDGKRLFQVLDILIQSASKFTARGSISLECSAQLVHDRSELVFRVRDTGVGFKPETLPKIFEPFSQIDLTFARQYGGVGLGLTMANQLLKMLGGTIEVESKLGQGSCFTVRVSFSRQL